MFVQIRWHNRPLAVPLAQLHARGGDPDTRTAIGDWHYWLDEGYTF